MSTILLNPYPISFPTPTARFLAQAWWTCYSSPPHTWRQRSDAIVATGEPLSVIPLTIRNGLDLEITPAPAWKGIAPTWMGVVCPVGQVTLWLPIQEAPGQYRSFALLVLLPQQDTPDSPPFIQLGVQFLLEYQAQLILDGAAPNIARILLP